MRTLVLLVWLPLITLANWQLIECWHHGSLFDRPRAWLEQRTGFWSDLLLCPFCLSHWTAVPLTTVVVFSFTPELWWLLPILSLSATRLSNLANDLTYHCSRTPQRKALLQAALDKLGQL